MRRRLLPILAEIAVAGLRPGSGINAVWDERA
jgi:hypothetical protein